MAKFKTEKHKKQNPSINTSSLSSAVSKIKHKFSFLRWLDPFTYVDLFVMPQVKKVTQNQLVEFLVNVFFALLFAWIIYTLLGAIFGTSTPLVIVYSASMENTFFRGDVMALGKVSSADYFGPTVFLNKEIKNIAVSEFVSPIYEGGKISSLMILCDGNCLAEIKPDSKGNVIVYPAYPSGMPIIHRTIALLVARDGNFVLTKGDNMLTNPTYDQDCGKIVSEFNSPQKPCITFYAIPIEQIQGKTFFMIPKIGCVKLWLVDDLFSVVSTGRLPSDFKGIC